MSDEITVIILLYEENLDTIYNCIKPIKNFKIIIVDNSNDKERKNKILKEFKIYKYIMNKKNLGFGKGNNIGIKNCDTKYLLILNADCSITKETISRLSFALNKYTDCYMTVPSFLDRNNKPTQNASPFPEYNIENPFIEVEGDMCCQSALGAAMFIKTQVMKDLKMFDENFFLYYEDIDLCKRINEKKKSVIQVYDAKAIHQHGEGKSVRNTYKKIYLVNLNMTFSELYYFYKINNYYDKFKSLKKKIPKYLIKLFLSTLFFKFDKSVFYLAKISAFIKFNTFIKKVRKSS